MTPAGLAALKAELRLDEGCRLTAYRDGGGVLTIGYGHTGPDVRPGLVWSQAKADAQLEADMAKAEADCARHIAGWSRLDDNAAFDREFLERFSDVFSTKPWACSMSEIGWAGEGFEGTKLAYLAAGAGFFYQRHRATHDCLAAIELLARRMPVSGRTGLAQLLERARTPSWRIWAENAPFDLKDILKARGYRWSGEGTGAPRAWFIDVGEGFRQAETTFLKTEIYRGEIDLLVRRVDAYDRYSERV